MAQFRSIAYVDANGAQGLHLIRTQTGAGFIAAAVVSSSNADYIGYWEGLAVGNPTPTPIAASYQPLKPSALLSFLCNDGSIATLRIPAPRIGIFQADQVTVDPSNALIAALITLCIGELTSVSGDVAASYLGGILEKQTRLG
jgi:hypothetical protein